MTGKVIAFPARSYVRGVCPTFGALALAPREVLACRVRAFSVTTLRMVKCYAGHLARWCEERGVMRPAEVTRNILERYQRHVFHMVNPRTQKHYTLSGQLSRLSPIRSFFKWLTRRYLVLYNAAADIKLPRLVSGRTEKELFLTRIGSRMSKNIVTSMVKKHLDTSGVAKSGACHLFRRTCATLMLEGGADIRYIQVLLGHSSLDSTQIYTQVAIRKLKEIHTLTHPGANLHPRADSSVSKPPEKPTGNPFDSPPAAG